MESGEFSILFGYNFILDFISLKVDVEVLFCFEWDDDGDRGVNGGDKLWVCDFFFFVFDCLCVVWFELFDFKGVIWDVIIKFNFWLVLNVL